MLHSLSRQCFRATPVRKSKFFRHVSKHINTCIKHNSIFAKQREIASIYSYNNSHVHLSSWCACMSTISECVLEERKDFNFYSDRSSENVWLIFTFLECGFIKEYNIHITKIITFIQNITTYGRKLLDFFFSYWLPIFYRIFSS